MTSVIEKLDKIAQITEAFFLIISLGIITIICISILIIMIIIPLSIFYDAYGSLGVVFCMIILLLGLNLIRFNEKRNFGEGK